MRLPSIQFVFSRLFNLLFFFQLTKEPPSSEIFLRLLRQCDDLDELRAVRQLITKEMDSVEINSL